LKPNLSQNAGIHRLQHLDNFVDVGARVEQNRHLGNIHRLRAKVVKVATQQLNQALVIAHTCLGTVGEKWEAEAVYC
jgi:3-polyprenyl-4-hydroxybenzoate decarboxylase